jgi:hypothetical protein
LGYIGMIHLPCLRLQLFDIVCPKASGQSSSATVTMTVDACNANYDSALGLIRVDQQKQIGE